MGLGGVGFSLKGGDETEQFDDKEAKRLIAAGIAEKAPPTEPKAPKTKAEWEDERKALFDEKAALVAENEQLKADAEAKAERLAKLQKTISEIAGVLPNVETAEQLPAGETRG